MHNHVSHRSAIALVAIAACLSIAACSSGSSHSKRPIIVDGPSGTAAASAGGKTNYDGDVLSSPLRLSPSDLDVHFTSTTGHQQTLRQLGAGKLMLLYFGYTHCPDVCPTTMADLGEALQQLPNQIKFHTRVVFVTSDPARDTAPVMQAWLSHFDSGLPTPFVGLTAGITQIDRVATSIGVPLSPPVRNPDGSITVQHGAQTMAFTDGRAPLLWLAGTTIAQYAHDIAALTDNGGSP